MGLADRDYMRERNRGTHNGMTTERERPFSPPSQQQSTLAMIFWWLLLAFVLYKGYGWVLDKKAHRPPTTVQKSKHEPEQVIERPMPIPKHQSTAVPSFIEKPAYTPPPAPLVTEASRPQTGGTIYHCKDYSGGTFWASNHCNQHKALIDRMVSVPPGLPFEQQVQIAEQHRQALTSLKTTTHSSSAPSPNSAVGNKALCESLDARVTQLDSMARQPQSGAMQDWIRMERQKTRDEQFRLRC